jgi:hypothetical protein
VFILFRTGKIKSGPSGKYPDGWKPWIAEVLTAASIKTTAFWDAAPCSLAGVERRLRDTVSIVNGRSPSTRIHGTVFQKAFTFKYP